ncbi:MAG: GNAT family N-acetyltransferase [Actinomycetota bacterium]
MARTGAVDVHPVTPDRWADLERLAGPRGAYAGCWCMWFRLSGREFEQRAGKGNRRALKGLVDEGRTPGLLAYLDGEPVGWVSVAPREEFGRIERSPKLARVDDAPVWSVVCFYMARGRRGQGIGAALLEAAVDHAAGRGATIVEGYPLDPEVRKITNSEAYHGLVPMFEKAGFTEVARRGGRPIMRRRVRRRSR